MLMMLLAFNYCLFFITVGSIVTKKNTHILKYSQATLLKELRPPSLQIACMYDASQLKDGFLVTIVTDEIRLVHAVQLG